MAARHAASAHPAALCSLASLHGGPAPASPQCARRRGLPTAQRRARLRALAEAAESASAEAPNLARPVPVGTAAPTTAAPALAAPAFLVRPWRTREDLERAAWLRAEAYYENRSVGRFKASFVKQFAGQEFYSLLRRTRGSDPLCLTLVAAERPADVTNGAAPSKAEGPVIGPGGCLGTLDVRVLSEAAAAQMEAMGGRWPDSVPRQPTGGPAAAYISNVVVAPSRRGRGLGRVLVSAATALAQERWGAAQLYCHVERDNQAALALYRACHFRQLGPELPPEDEGQGRRLLLCLEAER